MYISIPECRLLTGLTTTDISNQDLQTFINYSSSMIVSELAIPIKDEEPTGNIDGSNTTFEVSKYPIADVNCDGSIGPADVTVYQWTDEDDPSTKSSISVSTIYQREGYIVVTTAPSASIEKITIDYSFTYEEALSWDLIRVACAYLTAYLFCIKKFTVLPTTLSRGPLRFAYRVKPYDEYLKKYNDIMSLVRTKMYAKKTSVDMTLKRSMM